MNPIALLLDLANIIGGFLLAIGLVASLPKVGAGLGRAAAKVAQFGWLIGVVALVTGGFYLILHMINGPHVFHFEVVGIAVGVALLWDRLTNRPAKPQPPEATGLALLLAIFGLIAIIVGIQGIFTPDY